MTDAWEPKHYPTDGPMFERSHWMATLELNDLIEALNAEADAIGIGSGAPTARLLRRAASELRLRQLVDELPAAAEAINHAQEFDDLRAGQMMLELAEADQDEIEQLEAALEEARSEIAGLKAEILQWRAELEPVRESYERHRKRAAAFEAELGATRDELDRCHKAIAHAVAILNKYALVGAAEDTIELMRGRNG